MIEGSQEFAKGLKEFADLSHAVVSPDDALGVLPSGLVWSGTAQPEGVSTDPAPPVILLVLH